MAAQVFVFLGGCCSSDQCALEPGEEPMLGARRIQPMKIAVSVKNIDVASVYTCLEQCLNGRASAGRVTGRPFRG